MVEQTTRTKLKEVKFIKLRKEILFSFALQVSKILSEMKYQVQSLNAMRLELESEWSQVTTKLQLSLLPKNVEF
jgi:hypothetical protein